MKKKFFNTKKEAIAAFFQRQPYAEGAYKIKYGRHKGQWFVGTRLEYLNIY